MVVVGTIVRVLLPQIKADYGRVQYICAECVNAPYQVRVNDGTVWTLALSHILPLTPVEAMELARSGELNGLFDN